MNQPIRRTKIKYRSRRDMTDEGRRPGHPASTSSGTAQGLPDEFSGRTSPTLVPHRSCTRAGTGLAWTEKGWWPSTVRMGESIEDAVLGHRERRLGRAVRWDHPRGGDSVVPHDQPVVLAES